MVEMLVVRMVVPMALLSAEAMAEPKVAAKEQKTVDYWGRMMAERLGLKLVE